MKNIKQQNKIKSNTEEECEIVRFDWAIKNLLRNKANFDILEGFLSELLHQQIKIIKLLESESNKEHKDDKSNRVDILVETDSMERILIEVQTGTEWDFYSRMLFGASKLVTEYIDKGQPYHTIAKVISVNILFFNLGVGKDYIYKGDTEFKGVHSGDRLEFNDNSTQLYLNELDKPNFNSPSDVFPTYYIIQLKKFADRVVDKFDQWVYLLKNESIRPDFDAQGIISAKEKLDILKLPAAERRRYNRDMEDRSLEASLVDSHKVDVKLAEQRAKREEERAKRAEKLAKIAKEQTKVVKEDLQRAKASTKAVKEDLQREKASTKAVKEDLQREKASTKAAKEELQREKNRAKLEKITIAKRLKDNGLSVNEIANITGLSNTEVEQL